MTIHELDKLALYRPAEPVSAEDVKALVPEAVPGSVWAFTDAVGLRDGGRAAELLDRLAATTPEPVLLAVLHRRIRELLEVADHLAAGVQEETLPAGARASPVPRSAARHPGPALVAAGAPRRRSTLLVDSTPP